MAVEMGIDYCKITSGAFGLISGLPLSVMTSGIYSEGIKGDNRIVGFGIDGKNIVIMYSL